MEQFSSAQCTDELAPLVVFDPDEMRWDRTGHVVISGRMGTPLFTETQYAPLDTAFPVKLMLGPWPLVEGVHFRVKDAEKGIIEILELPGPPYLALVIESYYYRFGD